MPLQHIADPVLERMRRHVDGTWTRRLIATLRSRVPGVVLRTTLIVGHPGEGEAEFEELMDFIREARFERLGAFPYSEEEDTYGALHYADDVPQEVKESRYRLLMERQAEISTAFNESRVGTEETVLVDDWVDGTLVCRSQYESPEVDGEILVPCAEGKSLVGQFIRVRITAADAYDLQAEIMP